MSYQKTSVSLTLFSNGFHELKILKIFLQTVIVIKNKSAH